MLFTKMGDCSTNECFLKELNWLLNSLEDKAFHILFFWSKRTGSLYKVCITTTPAVNMEYSIHTNYNVSIMVDSNPVLPTSVYRCNTVGICIIP